MISGRETYSRIEKSLEDLERQERQVRSDVEGLTKHHASLLQQRTAAFRELAEVRMRSAISDGVIDEADALEHRVESLLKARQATVDALEAREGKATAERRRLAHEASGLRDRIAELEKRLDDVAEEVRAELAGDAQYKTLAAAREKAEALHAGAAEKARTAEKDRQQKGKAYEDDPLFMYLWRRDYGGKEYRPNALIRMADDWVAKLVRYNEARANYAILTEIPVRLKEHVSRLNDDVTEAVKAVEELEARRIEARVGEDLIGDLGSARIEQAGLNKALETIEAEIAEITRRLTPYAEGRDESFAEAVQVSAGFLERQRSIRLLTEARSTPDPSDDVIAERIADLERKAAETERKLADRREDLDDLSDKRREVLEVSARYRRNYFEDIASEFELEDIAEEVLEALVKGAISGAEYWARSRRRHSWKGRPADPFRKQSGLPPFGGGWGSGSRRGGRGGGFRTGGGF